LSFKFTGCQLNLASFYQLKLRGQKFISCDLSEVDFTETDLQKADFSDSNLNGAIFDNTIVESADFRMAHYFALDPQRNYISSAKFSQDNLVGLVVGLDIQVE